MHRHLLRSFVIASACLVWALLAASGCGGGDGSTGGSTSDPAPARTASGGGAPQLSAAVCGRLAPLIAARIRRETGSPEALRVRSSGTSTLSTCSFASPSATVSVSLDTAAESHQRFSNRLVEQIQFSDQDPDQLPEVVPGVGDPKANYGGADWVSARAQLLAIRGDRLLIIGFYIDGASDADLKDAAAALARRTYVITLSSTS